MSKYTTVSYTYIMTWPG